VHWRRKKSVDHLTIYAIFAAAAAAAAHARLFFFLHLRHIIAKPRATTAAPSTPQIHSPRAAQVGSILPFFLQRTAICRHRAAVAPSRHDIHPPLARCCEEKSVEHRHTGTHARCFSFFTDATIFAADAIAADAAVSTRWRVAADTLFSR